ncbi:hypothetical protein T4D_12416 [Trichinella pseudospiralis]|uniref:Uncharacterized protein n=1 Tax=Trichinella pseudospiralis TaxID=6337 RepID=A0A0V1G5T4_TRIPS|nr:hypothetical protein T4D_12416 [Trichinella pseudospiralis]
MPVYEFGSFLFLKPNVALIHQLFECLLKKYASFRKCPILTTLIRQIKVHFGALFPPWEKGKPSAIRNIYEIALFDINLVRFKSISSVLIVAELIRALGAD